MNPLVNVKNVRPGESRAPVAIGHIGGLNALQYTLSGGRLGHALNLATNGLPLTMVTQKDIVDCDYDGDTAFVFDADPRNTDNTTQVLCYPKGIADMPAVFTDPANGPNWTVDTIGPLPRNKPVSRSYDVAANFSTVATSTSSVKVAATRTGAGSDNIQGLITTAVVTTKPDRWSLSRASLAGVTAGAEHYRSDKVSVDHHSILVGNNQVQQISGNSVDAPGTQYASVKVKSFPSNTSALIDWEGPGGDIPSYYAGPVTFNVTASFPVNAISSLDRAYKLRLRVGAHFASVDSVTGEVIVDTVSVGLGDLVVATPIGEQTTFIVNGSARVPNPTNVGGSGGYCSYLIGYTVVGDAYDYVERVFVLLAGEIEARVEAVYHSRSPTGDGPATIAVVDNNYNGPLNVVRDTTFFALPDSDRARDYKDSMARPAPAAVRDATQTALWILFRAAQGITFVGPEELRSYLAMVNDPLRLMKALSYGMSTSEQPLADVIQHDSNSGLESHEELLLDDAGLGGFTAAARYSAAGRYNPSPDMHAGLFRRLASGIASALPAARAAICSDMGGRVIDRISQIGSSSRDSDSALDMLTRAYSSSSLYHAGSSTGEESSYVFTAVKKIEKNNDPQGTKEVQQRPKKFHRFHTLKSIAERTPKRRKEYHAGSLNRNWDPQAPTGFHAAEAENDAAPPFRPLMVRKRDAARRSNAETPAGRELSQNLKVYLNHEGKRSVQVLNGQHGVKACSSLQAASRAGELPKARVGDLSQLFTSGLKFLQDDDIDTGAPEVEDGEEEEYKEEVEEDEDDEYDEAEGDPEIDQAIEEVEKYVKFAVTDPDCKPPTKAAFKAAVLGMIQGVYTSLEVTGSGPCVSSKPQSRIAQLMNSKFIPEQNSCQRFPVVLSTEDQPEVHTALLSITNRPLVRNYTTEDDAASSYRGTPITHGGLALYMAKEFSTESQNSVLNALRLASARYPQSYKRVMYCSVEVPDRLLEEDTIRGNSYTAALYLALLGLPVGPAITGNVDENGAFAPIGKAREKISAFMNSHSMDSPLIYPTGSFTASDYDRGRHDNVFHHSRAAASSGIYDYNFSSGLLPASSFAEVILFYLGGGYNKWLLKNTKTEHIDFANRWASVAGDTTQITQILFKLSQLSEMSEGVTVGTPDAERLKSLYDAKLRALEQIKGRIQSWSAVTVTKPAVKAQRDVSDWMAKRKRVIASVTKPGSKLFFLTKTGQATKVRPGKTAREKAAWERANLQAEETKTIGTGADKLTYIIPKTTEGKVKTKAQRIKSQLSQIDLFGTGAGTKRGGAAGN